MDVDGTLTDGKIYMGVDGECFKAFDIKDGYALHTLLKENGIIPVIITARKSPMVEHRCNELGVTEIHQGVMKKLECLKGILEKYSSADQKYDFSSVAYIGDDLLDLQCMNPIKEAGGVAGCPLNAAKEVITVCDYVAPHKGGDGAVRDFVGFILEYNKNKNDTSRINCRIDNAIEFISKLDFANLKVGMYKVTPDFFFTVQEYKAPVENESIYESHRKYIDIQWVYEGREKLFIADVYSLSPSDTYNEEKDVIHYHRSNNLTEIVLSPGSCAILFPKDAHRVVQFNAHASTVKKVVGKLRICD